MNKGDDEIILTIVFSNWVLSKIFEFFKDYLNSKEGELGPAKIDRYKDIRTGEMRDSNRTIILMKKSLYNRAIEAKLDTVSPTLDFRICEYMLKEKNYPEKYYSSNLYMILPKNILINELEIAIFEKLNNLTLIGLLKREDYSLKIPLESRITGEHRGYAYVSFTQKVSLTTKAFIKVLFNDSFIYLPSITKLYHLPVFWAKETVIHRPESILKILKREM